MGLFWRKLNRPSCQPELEFPQKILSPELYRELNDRQFDHLARDLKTLFARSRRVSLPGASHSFLELKGEELSTMNLTQEQAMTLGCTLAPCSLSDQVKRFVVSSNKFEQGLSNLNELPSASFRAAIKLFGPIAWFDALALIFWGATLPFFFFLIFVPLVLRLATSLRETTYYLPLWFLSLCRHFLSEWGRLRLRGSCSFGGGRLDEPSLCRERD